MELTLDQKLKFEFANLDITGANKETFYTYKLQEFLFNNSELSPLQRIEATLIRMSNPLSEKSLKDFKQRHKPTKETDKQKRDYLQLNDNSEITIQKVLTERTFIQDQLTRHERNLNEILHPDNREKLNIWVDYLKMRQKNISEIALKVPEWSQPLIALYMIYKGIGYNDNNVKEVCEKLGYDKGTSELKTNYYNFRDVAGRTFTNIDLQSEKGKADAQLIRLNDLKLIMEDRNEKGSAEYEQLLSEIKELNKNLGYL